MNPLSRGRRMRVGPNPFSGEECHGLLARRVQRSLTSRASCALVGSAIVAGLLTLGGHSPAAQQTMPFRVVVNEANPATSVSADNLSAIFLKRRTSWAEGGSAQPIDLPAHSPVRDAFSSAALGRPVRAVVAYWQQQIFSGRGIPPVELATEAAVLEYVRTHPGAVGYVSTGVDVRGVKVLEVTR